MEDRPAEVTVYKQSTKRLKPSPTLGLVCQFCKGMAKIVPLKKLQRCKMMCTGSNRHCIFILQCILNKSCISSRLSSTSSINTINQVSNLTFNHISQRCRFSQFTKSSSRLYLGNKTQNLALTFNHPRMQRNFHKAVTSCTQQKKTQPSGTRASNAAVTDYKLQETTLDVKNSKYRVSFVDEGERDGPVVLCLHGMPACHKDFLPILPQLIQGGTRVLLLNFPGVGYSWHLEGPPFDYSHLTKAQLVSAFLSQLEINKVDLLVSHSSSGHSGLDLCANTQLIHNAALLCPIAHLPHGASKATLQRDIIYHLLKFPSLRALLGPTILAVFRKVAKMPIPEVEYFYGLIAESRTWNWKQAQEDLQKIHSKDMPVVVLAAKRDPIVQLYISKGVMDLVGIAPEDRLLYTKEGSWEPTDRKGNVNPLKYGIIFEKSSHWITKAHPDVVAGILLDFLKATQDYDREGSMS